MNQIKILFLIAFFIQTAMTGLEIVNEDETSLYDSRALICIDICFECFSDDQSIDVND
jgi:regulator of RNase E activity RraB